MDMVKDKASTATGKVKASATAADFVPARLAARKSMSLSEEVEQFNCPRNFVVNRTILTMIHEPQVTKIEQYKFTRSFKERTPTPHSHPSCTLTPKPPPQVITGGNPLMLCLPLITLTSQVVSVGTAYCLSYR